MSALSKSCVRRSSRAVLVASAFLCASAFGAAQEQSAPRVPEALEEQPPQRFERAALVKPAFTDVQPWHEPDRVLVKFQDDLPIRARDGRLVDDGSGLLSALAPLLPVLGEARWTPQAKVDEQLLATWRETAQRELGRGIADPRSFFRLRLPPGIPVQAACELLNTSELVELARPVQRPAPLPVRANPVPNWEPNQGYLNAAPDGIDARAAWFGAGTRGSGVRILDLEYQFFPGHYDLPPIAYHNQAQVPTSGNFANSGGYTNHGTAVLGVMLALDDGAGVVGIAPHAEGHFIGTTEEETPGGTHVVDIAGALLSALTVTGPGDVIVIEQQVIGPNYGGSLGSQFGLVPAEWLFDVYTAVQLAVGNGYVVVAAAGNGEQNLDGPEYSSGNEGHWPFLLSNDSGAILVGAGAAPAAFGGAQAARSRLAFSNYGSRLNVQGWGERIYTTGYGSLISGGLALYQWYTAGFGGTSGATPIVAGAAALVQSQHRRLHGGATLTSWALRALLRTTGTPQGGTQPSAEHIGPMPDVFAALFGGSVWVDFAAGSVQNGSFQSPFATLAQAVGAVSPGGNVFLKAGSTSAAVTISAPMTLGSYGGPVTIGVSGP